MKRLAGILGALGLAAMGCTVESDDPATMQTTGRVCSAVLSTTGTFAPDTANPQTDGGSGCWPYGTWTFSASVESNDCSPAPTPLAQYQVRVDYSTNADGDPVQNYTYVTEPGARHTVKVSQGGSGLCYAELLIYSADGKTLWLLKPSLNADNSLTGDGEFAIYHEDQWPQD